MEKGDDPTADDAAAGAPTQKLSPSAVQGFLAAAAAGVTRELREWQPPSVEDLQRALPQYEITELIARGGMGAVYKGTQRALKRAVAIKILPPDIDDGEAHYAERFKHEAQAMARLSHPNIVAVFDAGEVEMRKDAETGRQGDAETGRRRDLEKRNGGLEETGSGTPVGDDVRSPGHQGSTLLYFVMEYIEGTDVAQLIASEGRLPPARALPIITAVCEALAFAHEEGIIHRDIKPSNVMIDKKGRVKVADFGLAKAVNLESTLLTGSNLAMGTPDFIAPEALIAGTQVDGRADIYAVGVMLYQMLTGKIPRGRFSPPSVVVPKMDKRLDRIVDKAMQTEREKRYSTAGEMKTEVVRVTPKSAAAIPPATQLAGGSATKPNPAGKSARAPLLIGAAVVVAALGAGAFFMTQKPQAAAVFSSPALPVSKSSTEPAAIKLWDTPEKLPQLEGVSWDNGAVRVGKQALFFSMRTSPGAIARAAAEIDEKKGTFQLALRIGNPDSQNGFRRYYTLNLSARDSQASLRRMQGPKVERELQMWELPDIGKTRRWIAMEMKMDAGTITVSVDGRVLGTVPETLPPDGFSGLTLSSSLSPRFRDIEYVPLDKPQPSSSPSLPLSKSSTEPEAIKVWDTPETISSALKDRIRWENNALHLVSKGAVTVPGLQLTDVILRAEVLMNAESLNPQIGARGTGVDDTQGAHYSFGVGSDHRSVDLAVRVNGTQKQLGSWRLTRAYRTDEWLPLEVRIVGDEITVSAEGRVVGIVKDSTLQGAGQLRFYAKQDGWFRNVEYMPLDETPGSASPSLPVSKSSTAEPAAIKLWDTPDKLDNNPKAEWKDGAVHLTESTGLYARPLSRDAIIRASIRMNADAKGPHVSLRHRGDNHYRLAVNPLENYVALAKSYGEKHVTLNSWPLSRRYREDEWLRLELSAVGDNLTAKADGVLLGTVADQEFNEPGIAAIFATNGWFRDIEYVPLDTLAWQALPPPTPEMLKGSGGGAATVNAAGELTAPRGLGFAQLSARNMAVRGELKRFPSGSTEPVQISLRTGAPANEADLSKPTHAKASRGFSLGLKTATLQLNQNKTGKTEDQQFITLSRSQSLEDGDMAGEWVAFEFAVIGDASLAMLAGKSMPPGRSPEGVGQGYLQLMGGQFRKLEFIILDGLPETDALKLLGMDSQGKPAAGSK